MTNGELFIRENPNIEFKLNGSCVWIYFDGVNHYTMPVKWWDKEIGLFEDIEAEIMQEVSPDNIFWLNQAYGKVLQIIDKHRNIRRRGE